MDLVWKIIILSVTLGAAAEAGMSAGLLSKWMGHPNVANMHRRAPMARGRMQGYDIEDDSSEFVDQFPGDKPCVGACLHQKLLGIVDQGIEVADAAVANGEPCVGICQHFRTLGMRAKVPTNRF